MKNYLLNRARQIIASSVLAILPMTTWSAPPSTSPYATDPVNAHVEDETSDGVAQLNMVLCIANALDISDQVNAGAYLALVDKSKCDTSSQGNASNASNTSNGASAAPDYMNAIVNVTRASNSAPMIAKGWMSLNEQGNETNVYILVSVTQAPTSADPYGVFRLDYIGKDSGGNTKFNGFIDSTSSSISFYEADSGGGGGGSQVTSLALTTNSTTAGAGTMVLGAQTFNFAFDANLFMRGDGTTNVCFDRKLANAAKSVWQFGTYNAADGTRLDQANPGFQVLATYGGTSYYGFASYWGISFQGLDLNSIPDANPIAGLVVTDQRPNNSNTYTLSKLGGVLTKNTLSSTTLAAIDGFDLQAWGNFHMLTGSNLVQDGSQVVMHWDNTNQQFVITGQQNCSQNGCNSVPLSGSATITFTGSPTDDLNGYSQSLGGQLSIPHAATFSGTSSVNYFIQSTVIPGSAGAPTALYCLNNCVTSAALAAFSGSNSPFDATTATQWYTGNTEIAYTFDSGGLKESGNSVVAPSMSTSIFSGNYQNGIMTGKLFATQLTGVSGCPDTYCELGTDYYTWSTGPQQWDQSLWLTHSGAVVAISAPINIPYTVSASDDPSGTWVGKTIQLQFGGFGNLSGIPGVCVDPSDNSQVACGPDVRFVPAFALADGDTMSVPGATMIVKALNEELRLAGVSLGQCQSDGLAFAPQTPPTASGLHDPSNASDPDYLGTAPSISGAPKVIDGVVQ